MRQYAVTLSGKSPLLMHFDSTRIGMPADNIMRTLLEGGAAVPVPGGKNGKTFKAQTQSGMLVQETYWPILVDGRPVPMEPLAKLKGVLDFEKHEMAAVEHGFMLYVKRARIGASKHVRVRPRFDRWELAGTINVWDDQITTSVLGDVLRIAGAYKGLGDWRPSSPRSPGPFGRFSAEVKELK